MATQDLTETLISKETIYQGRILEVERWEARLPNGAFAQREIVRHRGAAAVVALDQAGRVALVRQYRCPLERLTLEIPAGKLDTPGEDPLACARRELREETGLCARSWQLLTPMLSTPGFCDEVIHLFLARGLSQGDLPRMRMSSWRWRGCPLTRRWPGSWKASSRMRKQPWGS